MDVFLDTDDIKFIKRQILKIGLKIDRISEFLLLNAESTDTDQFPIESEEQLMKLEKQMFENKDFSRQIVSTILYYFIIHDVIFFYFLQTQKLRKMFPKNSKDLSRTLRDILSPEILINYNWDGRANKKKLNSFLLFSVNMFGNFHKNSMQ